MPHTSFTTTRGLDRDLPSMRLYEKVKVPGVCDSSGIVSLAASSAWRSRAVLRWKTCSHVPGDGWPG
jgi:hypothetical protein